MPLIPSVLMASGSFLLAVLWFDLMFDVQVLPYRGQSTDLPEPVLAAIAAYYRRVTTSASPMGYLVAMIMFMQLAGIAVQIVSDGVRALSLGAAGLGVAPMALGLARTFPNAVRLGRRSDTAAEQTVLARSICRDHFVCLAAILGFILLQFSMLATRA